MRKFFLRGGRRGFAATVTTVVFVASGTAAIAMAVAAQKQAPEPPASAAGSLGPAAEPPAPGEGPPPARSLPAAAREVVRPVLPRSNPVSLDIPAIGVQSPVQYVGLTEENTLEVPAPGPRYDDAAWYKLSATPGSLGPAIIIGHRDSAARGPSVFYRLGDLRPGDKLRVTRADGVVAVFEVNGVRTYPKDDFPTMRVYGKTKHAALRLITCGGAFDQGQGSYDDNIVVYASLVGSRRVEG